MTFISRRDLLKSAAAITAGARTAAGATAGLVFHSSGASAEAARAFQASDVQARGPLENLSATEKEILEAIVGRLIPTDALGPGAIEAGVARYIDRALGGGLAASRQAYATGLAALDRYARSLHGASFTQLSPGDQDAILTDVEKGAAAGFTGGSASFFNLVLNHTHQGMFGDPHYGGNANFIGWDLIGYPGVRTMVSPADQQRLESNELKPNRKSAYEYDTFTKAAG